MALIVVAAAGEGAPARQVLAAELGTDCLRRVAAEASDPPVMRLVQHLACRRVDVDDVRRQPAAVRGVVEQAQGELEPVLAHVVRVAPARRAVDLQRIGRHAPTLPA